ncbi:MAG: response regulator [Planctomycetes bacterium]|nr:response regulator [Planctomycetota bacterium]
MPDSKVNILVVDDEPANLLSLRAILDDLGHDVVEARSGEEALERLLADTFAVILLDVRMSGLGGFETARLIRSQERSRRTPIIFLTAHETDRPTLEQAYAIGAVDYLIKPLVPPILRAKVAWFVELFEATEQVKRQAEQLRQLERREFERRLAEQNVRVAAMLSSIGDAVITTDTEGRVTFLNPSAQHLTGWREEALGKDLPEVLQIVSATTREPVENAATRVLRQNEMVGVADDTVLIRKDGMEIPIDDSGAPIRDEHGNIAGVVLVFRDITERRRLEQDLRQRVQELAEADRRKNEFLAMLSHELRNPLAPIRHAFQVVRAGVSEQSEEFCRACDIMERQIEHLVRLVDDLLDVSRVSQGMIRLCKERLDLAAVVARVIEGSQTLIDARRHTLEVMLPSLPLPVEADPVRLAQVVWNLLNNAAKYTPQGGRIRVAVEQENGQAVVRVRDSGVGIAPEMLSRVFDLFTQGEHTLDRAEGGLGIGLTLVRRLTEMHGGTAQGFSAGPGQGSEFVVRIPLLRDARAAARPEEPSRAPGEVVPVSGRRILVVDDNRDAAECLAMLLRLYGNDVRIAHQGQLALELADTYRPDLVLLDIGLPDLSGLEVCRRLRAQPGGHERLVVAVTGYGDEDDRRRCLEAGFDAHLVKPADLAALQGLLDTARSK